MPEDLQRLIEGADKMQQQGQFAEAESSYTKLLQLVPDNVPLLLRLIQIRYRLGKNDETLAAYNHLLTVQPDCMEAHTMMATITQPGDDYLTLIKRFHHWLKPAGYIEIGVETGRSLSLVLPKTHAIGIDPNLKFEPNFPLGPLTKTYEMPSDDFFARYDLLKELGIDSLDLAFIDGLHHFDQALKDFMNIERCATRDTVILVHDCYPLDKATSSRKRATTFWSGDTWKTMVCLKQYRPDLNLFTIPTPPTGLGVITNLDPGSTHLTSIYDQIVETFTALDYDYLEANKDERLNVVPNQWETIKERIGI